MKIKHTEINTDFVHFSIQLIIGIVICVLLYKINANGVISYLSGVLFSFVYQYTNRLKIKNGLPLFSYFYLFMKVFYCDFVLFCIAYEYFERKSLN